MYYFQFIRWSRIALEMPIFFFLNETKTQKKPRLKADICLGFGGSLLEKFMPGPTVLLLFSYLITFKTIIIVNRPCRDVIKYINYVCFFFLNVFSSSEPNVQAFLIICCPSSAWPSVNFF